MKKLLTLVSLILILVGCRTSPISVDIQSHIDGRWAMCRGAVIGSNTVMTVMHCVNGSNSIWVDGMPVYRVNIHRTVPESLVLLEIKSSRELWSSRERFQIAFIGSPVTVVGPNGSEPWVKGVVKPGYSGSPVLNSRGQLIGLVYGYRSNGTPLMVKIPRNW